VEDERTTRWVFIGVKENHVLKAHPIER